MTAATLMVQGTTSDAGKSTLVAALCRVLHRRGVRVAPFKPQNMALNSAVSVDGGEIGRAQAVQAQAAGLPPHTDMNPVLIKPNSDIGAQIIIEGRVFRNMDAAEYHDYKPIAREAVLKAHDRLAAQYDVIIAEGAGSPAEINLREGDIANMGFAEAVDCPVLLVADIDRGGVFASLVGTLALLSDSERERVRGVVINRFRGDLSLLESGLDWFERHNGMPVLGVLPWIPNLHLEAEDAIPKNVPATGSFRVTVPVLPRISNHTDFDPLRLHPGVDLQFVGPGEAIPASDLVILPGSKSVCADLQWLRDNGWENALNRHLRFGGKVLGICGGYQMMGATIRDPDGVEGDIRAVPGFGWLDLETTIQRHKRLRNVSAELIWSGSNVNGYEIHAGITVGPDLSRPMYRLADGVDGAVGEDGQVMGGYLHGLFETEEATRDLLQWAGMRDGTAIDYIAHRELELDRLADTAQDCLQMDSVFELCGLGSGP